MFNNNKSIITPLHKKNCRPLSVLSLRLKKKKQVVFKTTILTIVNNNKSIITPLHKKLSTIVCIVVKTKNIKPVVF